MKTCRLLLTLLCAQGVSVLMQSAEVEIRLVSGAAITGDLLKEGPEGLVVDLGFDVLRIPKVAVAVVKQLKDGKAPSGTRVHGNALFRELGNARTKPLQQLVSELGGAVVMVRTPSGLGSGFLVHPEGYVVTNDHVIAGERKISVTQFRRKGSELTKDSFENVRIVASGGALDLALLKIEGTGKKDFPTVPLGSSAELEQGERVFAIGSPLGLERSVSEGIVSLRNRLIRSQPHVQTTAEISPGNSGGPLFNYKGEVVGVNNMKVVAAGAEGLGFSIPVRTLKTFLMNRDAYAFDTKNPNAGYLYLSPPGEDN